MAAHCLWGLRSWRSSFIPNSTSLRIASYQFSAKSAVISLGTIRKRLSTLTHKDYTIGWISALDSELTAAIAMLDEQHGSLKNDLFDSNTYTLGRIGEHNVVLACLPLGQLGTNSAAAVASQMTRSFDSIRFGLMVGIGGGVPNLGAGLDIRLGDVVVSKPSPRHGGVVQYDFGKTLKGGKFEYSGHLNAPPTVLLTALTKLRAMHALQGFMFTKKLQAIEPLHLQHDFAYPGANHDRLFEANYPHGDRSSCVDCDIRRLVERDIRTSQEPVVHYGLIASGNQVMKDAVTRDRLRDEHGILCFEMEAAGLMNHFPCIVIRGVCDYSDSHKNDRWQTYAAATAAAYAKELLGTISPSHVESTPTLEDIKDIEVMVQGHQDLRTTDYKQHKDRNPVRVDRTCEWFLKHPTFVAWRETTQSSLLWVSANPGCGKSVLAKSLVDNELKSTDSRKTCYFFFKDDNISQRSATNALCALLHQLFSQKPELLKKALPHFKKNGSKLPQLFTALWDTLVDVSTDPKAGEIICVLDALDECEKSDQVHLINAFDRFYRNYPGGGKKPILKVLVTSRPYFDIERQFRGLTTLMPSIRLVGEEETESISREIDIFIKARVQEIGSRLNLEDSVCSYLEQRLLNIEHRTYLWLKLILELIYSRLDVTTERRLRAIIDTLPDTVEKTYEAILERSTDVDQAKKLLHIIVSAVRPMTLREINVALAVEEGSKSYEDLDLEPDSSFPTTVRNLCGLFVSVVDSKLYLIHQTAKEFLVSDKHAKQHAKHGICSNGAWKCSLEPAESNLVLAKICISYLLFAEFESDPLVIDDRDSDRVIEGKVAQYTAKHDFLDYAAKHWATHLLRVGTDEQVAVFVSNIGFWDSRSKRFLTWFPIYWTTLATFRFPQNFTHLMTASYFGHAGIVAYLLQKGASIDVNCKDSTYGWTPLWWAAWHGQEVIAILLLKETSRVDVNARASNSWTLLLWAAETGSGEIVKLLLERGTGVDVNAKDSHFGRTPLWWAAQSRHEAIVTLLLEKADGIEVNSKDCNDQTLLSWAAQIGDERTVALLLETGTGIDVDSKDHNGLTPLLLAVQNGHEEVVSILLKKGIGINVNAKDRNGRTPLWWAAWSGNKAITALLLELETIVDVNCEDCRGRTPLSMAARKGSYAVVEMLLERGIDINVNSKDHRDWTPMLWGASNGHERVVDALLEKGVGIEIDSRDSDNRTPLWWAANNGYSEVVAVLLEKGIGIDVNSKDSKYGGTPLWWAARNGYSQVVTVLLEKGVGVDVNAKDSKYGGTPLWWAARNGYLQVVAVLLEKGNGVDANAKDSESGGTPLWWAARNGYSQVVALLLEKGIGVDVNSKESESGGTPLFWAIRNRHMAVIKLLSPPTSK